MRQPWHTREQHHLHLGCRPQGIKRQRGGQQDSQGCSRIRIGPQRLATNIPTQDPPASISAVRQMISNWTKQRANTWWKKSPRYRWLKEIDPSLPSGNFAKITSTLTRSQTSILTQLRTGHAPVFSHLHRIGCSDMPKCPQESCNHTTEDIHHLLFICPTYTQPRYRLIHNLGRNKFSLSKLLTDAKVIPHTIAFINSTSCFKHIFRDIGDCERSLLH